ncbi:MAG: acetyl-CoA carboxylase biotin carboxyl carrier protein subunit [Pigmentiphaga sp.]|nr:acetyl-CoA carboxylase biotin carboxyl carrier protein subunit [Pigmentiphaga sp.]
MSKTEVIAEVTGTVWKIEVPLGGEVAADEPILIAESMKMEIPVLAPHAGKVVELRVAEGDAIEDGQVVAVVEG